MSTSPSRPELTEGSPRRSRGRPRLPLDRIIATATALLDEEGADALSMRNLAQRLDSGTATLYRHFTGRADLVAQVIDSVLAEAHVDDATLDAMTWQQACEALAHGLFDVFRRHPHVAPLLVEKIPIGPNAMAQREQTIALLLKSGFAAPLAAQACATLARYVVGFATQLSPSGANAADQGEVWQTLDPQVFPATVSVADHLPVPLEREFAFGLELLINGLSQLAPKPTARKRR
ncbi:TetR/AcrR family transcriptional regulator [Mycolicibacterium houstonense]|uniref:TetR/AcrR family transcriptional regulator n=1 Tax=Mycolicibacterium houstonense TaxID=146021 RepID=UPI000A42BCFD|nr:TetR/AcrR family transcriptional regulator [Mycolicibacterium houstonense]